MHFTSLKQNSDIDEESSHYDERKIALLISTDNENFIFFIN